MMGYNYTDYQTMMGGSHWAVAPFMWITYLLVVVVLVLAIVALLKYINKK
jgi:uncharacterized membrane protein